MLTPAASAGTRNRPIPLRSRRSPETRAETTISPAESAFGTTDLAPFSTKPSPLRRAVVATSNRS